MEKFWGGRETRPKSRILTKQRPQVALSGSESVSPSKALRSRAPLVVARDPPEDSIISGTSASSRVHPPQPYSQTEQYWAARALSAETLLSARTAHHNEVRGVLLAAESRRTKELYELAREHNMRHARLENLVIGLFLSLFAFVLYVIYLLAHPFHKHPRETSRWSTMLPNHFTIPVLSPFTSVVESETAIIGARTIVVFIVVAGGVAYGILRHRSLPHFS